VDHKPNMRRENDFSARFVGVTSFGATSRNMARELTLPQCVVLIDDSVAIYAGLRAPVPASA